MILKLHTPENGELVLVDTTGIYVRPQGQGSRVFVVTNYIDVIETVAEIYDLINPPIEAGSSTT